MMNVILDFDGVIHNYSQGWKNGEIYDAPVEGIKEAIEEIRKEYRVVVVSTRCYSPGGIDSIREWLATHEIEVDDVTGEKPPAFITVDDRAICFDGHPESLIFKIKNFKHWSKR